MTDNSTPAMGNNDDMFHQLPMACFADDDYIKQIGDRDLALAIAETMAKIPFPISRQHGALDSLMTRLFDRMDSIRSEYEESMTILADRLEELEPVQVALDTIYKSSIDIENGTPEDVVDALLNNIFEYVRTNLQGEEAVMYELAERIKNLRTPHIPKHAAPTKNQYPIGHLELQHSVYEPRHAQ